MNLRTIARALQGVVNGQSILAPGPGHSRHDRSLSVWIDIHSPEGFRVHSFAGDDWRVCRDFVRQSLGLPIWEPGTSMPPRLAEGTLNQIETRGEDDDRERVDRAMALWKQAVGLPDTPVEGYLQSRNINLPECVLTADALRFHPACPFRLDTGATTRLPAMLSLMRDINTDEPRAVHRTALKPDGSGKADLPGLGNAKKMLGPSKNAVVKLTSDSEVTNGLGIAEGIETALTLLSANWRPLWACGSAGAIERFPVLSGIEALTIFADADGAGMTAALKCQARWNDAEQECRVLAAPTAGSDWNDLVRAA